MNGLKAMAFCLLMTLIFCRGNSAPAQDKNAELAARLAEVRELQGRQRFVDALLKLDEIEAAFPGSSDVHSLRGSIQLAPAIRDFAKAETSFNKAAELAKDQLAPSFNLAELSFVRHDWTEARKRFEALVKEHPKMPMQIRHLAYFKILICQLKTGDAAAAEQTLKDNFTFMDDTPAYYFSKAALAFHKEEKSEAQSWLAKAASLFGDKPSMSYMDSLIEARWVPHIGLPPVTE